MRWPVVIAVLVASAVASSCRRVATPPPSAAKAASASVVHRDPVTGRFGPPPAATSVSPSAARAAAAPVLTEQPGVAGGYVIRLQNRFHSQMKAFVEESGRRGAICREQADPRDR